MDHLPYPKNPIQGPREIPYLCTEELDWAPVLADPKHMGWPGDENGLSYDRDNSNGTEDTKDPPYRQVNSSHTEATRDTWFYYSNARQPNHVAGHQWGQDRVEEPVTSTEELLAVIQAWLYFGLIAIVLGEPITSKEFTRYSIESHRLVVDTTSLHHKVSVWLSAEDDRDEQYRKQQHARLTSVIDKAYAIVCLDRHWEDLGPFGA
ncbi:MAG: hypothetical protein M1836_001100 [Candelina mexicana]|nr:MAG: hypothetical protein M1836_001100 [Candelina mexicana]